MTPSHNMKSQQSRPGRELCAHCGETFVHLKKHLSKNEFCGRIERDGSPETIEIGTLKVSEYRALTRREALIHYGGSPPSCRCCGEQIWVFLTLDHTQNDGANHRRKIGTRSIVAWLKKHNWPEGFSVLCYNCNVGRYRNGGICPHKGANARSL